MKTTQIKAIAIAFAALLAWNLFGSSSSTAEASDRVRFGISFGTGGSGLYYGSGYGYGYPAYAAPVYSPRVYPVYPPHGHCGPPVIGHHYRAPIYRGHGVRGHGYRGGYFPGYGGRGGYHGGRHYRIR